MYKTSPDPDPQAINDETPTGGAQATTEASETQAPPQPEPSTPDTPIDYNNLEVHPFAELIPSKAYTQWNPDKTAACAHHNIQSYELKASIQEHGLLDKPWLYEAMVLDGRIRIKVCHELGIKLKATDFRTFTGTRDEALRFVIKLNLTSANSSLLHSG